MIINYFLNIYLIDNNQWDKQFLQVKICAEQRRPELVSGLFQYSYNYFNSL